MAFRVCKSILWHYRKPLFVFFISLLALPLPLLVSGQEAQCGYLMIVMAVLWCTEIIPLAVTGLLPIFIVPMMGIITAKEISYNFLNDNVIMISGSIIVGLTLEKSNLHRRIALRILLTMGAKPGWLMLGFMLPTWFLAMYISNTATTAMMFPILEEVLCELERTREESNDINMKEFGPSSTPDAPDENGPIENGEVPMISDNVGTLETNKHKITITVKPEKDLDEIPSRVTSDRTFHHFCVAMTLSVPYAATAGGVGTLTGTSSNMVTKMFADEVWQNNGFEQSPINYTSWMVFTIPLSAINLLLIWLWLQALHIRSRSVFCCRAKHNIEEEKIITGVIRSEHNKLGPIRTEEVLSAIVFTLLVLLWFFRDPGFITGWDSLFEPGYVSGSAPAMLLAFLVFVIPSNFTGHRDGKGVSTMLDWNTVKTRFPWHIIFLFGGGFALADACMVSGLSTWLGSQLSFLDSLPGWLMVAVLSLILAALTEFTSNNATTTLLMPVAVAMAEEMGRNPLYLMLPTGIATQMAFMLPVATPPNAIAFANGRIKVVEMLQAGWVLNLICIGTLTLATETWGMAYFNLDTLPWEQTTNTSTTMSSVLTL